MDGELPGTDMLAIRRHLSECPDCAEEWEAILFTKRAVSRLRTAVPRKDFAASIIVRLDEVQVPPYQRAANSVMRFIHGRLSPVAAALAASGLALVILTAGGVGPISVDTSSEMAALPMEASMSRSAFLGEVANEGMSFGSQRPLVVADQTSDYAKPDIHLAGLNLR